METEAEIAARKSIEGIVSDPSCSFCLKQRWNGPLSATLWTPQTTLRSFIGCFAPVATRC